MSESSQRPRFFRLVLDVLLLTIAVAGVAWWLDYVAIGIPPSASEALLVGDGGAPAPSMADGELPRAWRTPTRHSVDRPLVWQWEPTPTSTPTKAATSRASPAPSATATATPTLSPSPTLTPTRLHAPATEEPTWLEIPAIGLGVEVVPVEAQTMGDDSTGGVGEAWHLGVTWDVADYAAGYHRGTALPGHPGNTLIAGHNNIRGEVFRDLHLLGPGDEVLLWVGPHRYHYVVDVALRLPVTGAPVEVLRDNLRYLQPTDDERLTLVTCWPPWSNTHRTVVVCLPAPYPPSQD